MYSTHIEFYAATSASLSLRFIDVALSLSLVFAACSVFLSLARQSRIRRSHSAICFVCFVSYARTFSLSAGLRARRRVVCSGALCVARSRARSPSSVRRPWLGATAVYERLRVRKVARYFASPQTTFCRFSLINVYFKQHTNQIKHTHTQQQPGKLQQQQPINNIRLE